MQISVYAYQFAHNITSLDIIIPILRNAVNVSDLNISCKFMCDAKYKIIRI